MAVKCKRYDDVHMVGGKNGRCFDRVAIAHRNTTRKSHFDLFTTTGGSEVLSRRPVYHDHRKNEATFLTTPDSKVDPSAHGTGES